MTKRNSRALLLIVSLLTFTEILGQDSRLFTKTSPGIEFMEKYIDPYTGRLNNHVQFLDFDQDGDEDVLVVDSAGPSGIYTKNGIEYDLTFPIQDQVYVSANCLDIDGDGDFDLITQKIENDLYFLDLFLFKEDSFHHHQQLQLLGYKPEEKDQYSVKFELIDIDLNGKLDLVTSAVLIRYADNWLFARTFISEYNGSEFSDFTEFDDFRFVHTLAKGDFNSDGYSDLVLGIKTVGVGIIYSDADQTFDIDTIAGPDKVNWISDLDDDEVPELISDRMYRWSDSTLSLMNNIKADGCDFLKAIDYNNDGYLDIIRSEEQINYSGGPDYYHMYLHWNDHNWSFESEFIGLHYHGGIYITDYNNDGFDDIISSRSIFLNKQASRPQKPIREDPLNVEKQVELSIYPNPASNTLHFDIPNQNYLTNIQIFTMQGKVLMRRSIDQERSSIDISNLRPGYYIIRTDEGTINNKLIISQ